MHQNRQCPIGAEITTDGVHFRVWAPAAKVVKLILDKGANTITMQDEPDGYKSIVVPTAKAGTLYQFQLNGDDYLYPDPASRAQPSGPHGPSMVIDPTTFKWSDDKWRGVTQQCNIIYEMHIGTFTREGTYRAAADELKELANIGITIVELMPICEFDGDFGWGYDGVDLYAPYHAYGTPDDLRFFVDKAHSLGLAVILDVVYNHIGSSGCYFTKFSPDYLSSRYKSEWGDTFNYDGDNSTPVREFILQNALYWIREFHFDGFRFDATQQIFDESEENIVALIVRSAREIAPHRQLYFAGENEPQDNTFIKTIDDGGFGCEALWNDDFHHSAMVAATGRAAAYFSDYTGSPQEFISNLKYGFLYQGQYYRWQKKCRGTPTFGLPPHRFIHYLQNHDQVANGGRGLRLHQLANPALARALTAILLLGPQTPLLFQGQEYGATTPFLYFADNPESLAEAVAKGRNDFLHQFPYLAQSDMQAYLSRPEVVATFLQSKLNFAERDANHEVYQLNKDLMALRKTDPVFNGKDFSHLDGALVSEQLIVLRFFSVKQNSDRLLLVNFGRDCEPSPAPEPLIAPHAHCDWQLAWSSEAPQYGGHGSAPPFTQASWQVPGYSAVVLVPLHSAS